MYPPSHRPITGLHLQRAAVDAGEHFGGVAGDDDVDEGRAGSLGHAACQGSGEVVGVLDPDAVAAERLGDAL